MSRTPAAEFARVKLAFPLWNFTRITGPDWSGYVAQRRRTQVTATTLVNLERRLLALTEEKAGGG
ncbi:MAG TPA: hypothetical protein VIV12_23595 [Streptosporangiaceae bacterium]